MQLARSLVIPLVLASFLGGAAHASDDPMPKRKRLHRIESGPTLGAGLRLLDGRKLYRGSQGMGDHFPYLIAANESEVAEKYGYPLHTGSAHQLLAPIESEAQALELTRWLVAGDIVPDRAAFDRMREIAIHYEMPEGSWPVKVEEFVPSHYGLRATRGPDGFEVRGTLFTTPGGAALCVIEFTIIYPPGEKLRLELNSAITGPPQSWQTGFHDPVGSLTREERRKREEEFEAEQKKLHDAIQEFRDRMLRALRKNLSVDDIRKIYAQGGTWSDLRRALGEPNRVVGKTRTPLYFLGNSTVVAIPAGADDAPLPTATVYSSYHAENGFGPKLEEIQSGL